MGGCPCHVTYTFKSEPHVHSCLNVKELLARNRREIWSLSDCNGIRTHNHLVCKCSFTQSVIRVEHRSQFERCNVWRPLFDATFIWCIGRISTESDWHYSWHWKGLLANYCSRLPSWYLKFILQLDDIFKDIPEEIIFRFPCVIFETNC